MSGKISQSWRAFAPAVMRRGRAGHMIFRRYLIKIARLGVVATRNHALVKIGSPLRLGSTGLGLFLTRSSRVKQLRGRLPIIWVSET